MNGSTIKSIESIPAQIKISESVPIEDRQAAYKQWVDHKLPIFKTTEPGLLLQASNVAGREWPPLLPDYYPTKPWYSRHKEEEGEPVAVRSLFVKTIIPEESGIEGVDTIYALRKEFVYESNASSLDIYRVSLIIGYGIHIDNHVKFILNGEKPGPGKLILFSDKAV